MRFQTTWLLFSALSLGVLLQACETDTPIAVDDGGRPDARVDSCVIVDCAAPPMGCQYEGGDPCTSCGTLVCDDAGAVDAGSGLGCATCTGTVVSAYPGGGGFRVDCPAGEVVGFAGIQRWIGPGLDLFRLACAVDNTGFEPQFDVCCIPEPVDGGVDAGAEDAGGPNLCLAVLCGPGTTCDPATGACVPDGPSGCDPSSATACGAGQSCCYPCGIPGCAYQCEPSCVPGTPGCAGGCVARP